MTKKDKEAQLKAKLLKMKLAASKKEKKVDKKLKKIGDNHNRILKKELDARPLIKEVPMGVDKRDNSKINYFSKMKAENDAIETGTKIRPNKPTDEDFGGIITAKAKVNKLKTAIVKSPDKYKVPREMKHTRVDSDGPLVNKVPFGEEDRETKQQGMDRIMRDSSYDVKNKKVRPATPTQADRKRIITAQEHHHKISFRGHKIGGFKGASLSGQSGKYAKYWLLNAKETNGNGWGIAAHTAKENMKKFIGRPLVVTASSWHGASEYGDEYEHPYLPTNDINAILNHQEKFRVGSIVDVFEDSHGDWFASIEMLPKFASSRLPPFCSPAIYQLDASEAEGQISKWEALHLAALTENPAYGARIALLKGTCVGTDNECKVQFKSAKQESGIECPVKEKQKKVKSKISKLKNKQKVSSLKQRLATVSSNTPTPSRNPFNKPDNPDRAIDDDVYFSDNPSGLNDIDPNRNRKRKPTSFDDKYDPNRLPMAEDFMGQGEGPDRKVGDTVRDKLPNIPASRLEGTGPDTHYTRNEGESELSFKRWEDTQIEGHKFPGDKEVDKKLRSLFDGPFDKKYLYPSDDDVEVDTEVEWNLDEYHENQGDVPLKETKTTNVYDNSLKSIYGLAEEGFTGKYEDRFIVGDRRKWEQAKRKLQQYMPIGDNDPDDILNFMLDRGIDSFSNKGITDISRKNAERFSKLKKNQKISKVKARLAVDTSKIKKKKYFNDKTLDRAYNVTMQGGIEDTDKTFDNPAKRKSPFENFQIRKKIDNSIGNNSVVSNPNKGTNDDKKASGSTVINSFKNKRMKKIAKLKLKLANLGEQNMTYQDSKKVKIHKKKHPEVRKAKSSVEDILRGKGRSVDGTHHESTFLSTKGDFIGGGDSHAGQALSTDNTLSEILDVNDVDGIVERFSSDNSIPKVQHFPINRAGEKKTSVGIFSKINSTQLKSLKDIEEGGGTLGFAVGTSTSDIDGMSTGEGYRDLTKALKERKFLG